MSPILLIFRSPEAVNYAAAAPVFDVIEPSSLRPSSTSRPVHTTMHYVVGKCSNSSRSVSKPLQLPSSSPNLCLISPFRILLSMVTPSMHLRHLISKVLRVNLSLLLSVHVSEAYVAIGIISVLCSQTFSGSDMSRLFQTTFLSLRMALAAIAVRWSTSSVEFGIMLPR